MRWFEIIKYWVVFQIGNWLSFFTLDTSLQTTLCGMFFTGTFTAMLAVVAKVNYENKN